MRLSLFALLLAATTLFAQPRPDSLDTERSLPAGELDPFRVDDDLDSLLLLEPMADPCWGYCYDQLLLDLLRFSSSPAVSVDSIGHTVEGRAIWEVTVTDHGSALPKQRVYVHARTHPNEPQPMYVALQMLDYLTSDDPYARTLRERAIFHIVPIANPDGVELGYGRQNANGIDLERDWDKDPMQPESRALRDRVASLMQSPSPIRVALNLHSASACQRFFVFHDASGTSPAYALTQQRFIDMVRARWPEGIRPWDYNVTWVNETPTHFPESWWWRNWGSTVLALTYEDMNCDAAGDYDRTAQAILGGVGEYLSIPATVRRGEAIADELRVVATPNPLVTTTTLTYSIPSRSTVRIVVRNLVGEVVDRSIHPDMAAGTYDFHWRAAVNPPGTYLATVEAEGRVGSVRLVVVR